MNPTLCFALTLAAVLAANASSAAVLDINGETLGAGVGYYVLPVLRGSGGGLTLADRGSEFCHADIAQTNSELDKGVPVKFSNWAPRVGFVPESVDLNINTVERFTICMRPTFWWIDNFDEERKQWFVTTGPEPSGFGPESRGSFFKIQKSGDDYKFAFCPRVCSSCKPVCSDVGIFVDEKGVRRLALSDVPFEVKFMKANETEFSTKTM